jgi:hypothetical protein
MADPDDVHAVAVDGCKTPRRAAASRSGFQTIQRGFQCLKPWK